MQLMQRSNIIVQQQQQHQPLSLSSLMKNFVHLCLLFCLLSRPAASLDLQHRQPQTATTTTAVAPALSSSSPFRTFQTSFQLLRKLGKGAYGHVYCARDLATGELVAAKRVISKRSALEAEHLSLCRGHPSIIQFKEVVLDDEDSNYVYIIMELAERSLRNSLKTETWDERRIRNAIRQLIDGVGYLHRVGIIHQDLKPENILLMSNANQLKIADLGLGRSFDPSDARRLVEGRWPVGTLWYMPPEILSGAPDYTFRIVYDYFQSGGHIYTLGVVETNNSPSSGGNEHSTLNSGAANSLKAGTEDAPLKGAIEYSPEMDMWSVGCIMAELVSGKPLFDGNNAVDQLSMIHDVLGTQQEQFAAEEFDATDESRPQPWIRRLRDMIPPESLSPLGFDLLTRLLYLDPRLRYTADRAIRHQWFSAEI